MICYDCSCNTYNQFYLTNLFSPKLVALESHNIFLFSFTSPSNVSHVHTNILVFIVITYITYIT